MNENKKKLEKLNILSLGETTVGKTCFILRYTENTYIGNSLSTFGIDYKTKKVDIPNKKSYNVNFFDTCGQEKYHSISLNQIKNAHGIILMYDVTQKNTFDAISKWIEDIKKENEQNVPLILVGNKCDLKEEKVVTTDEGQKLAEKFGINFFEVSNQDGTNVEEAALCLINKIIEEKEKKNNQENGDNIKLDPNIHKEKKKRKCNC